MTVVADGAVLRIDGPVPLNGKVRVPGDKSVSHRALMLAALADGVSELSGVSDGDDVRRTAGACAALGAEIRSVPSTGPGRDYFVRGGRSRLHRPAKVIDLGNSGTGIRLLSGIAAGCPWRTVLTGDDSLRHRPMDRVMAPLRAMGAGVSGLDGGELAPLEIDGGDLHGIDYRVPVPSAQVKSAILLAALNARGATIVRESVRTRSHTEEMLLERGVALVSTPDGQGRVVEIEPGEVLPLSSEIPADPSQAAFWIVAALIIPDSTLTVTGVCVSPERTGYLEVLRRMGGDIAVSQTGAGTADVTARSSTLHGTVVHGSENPGLDEIAILSVAATAAAGETVFEDVGELRVKESDRLATIESELSRLGAEVVAENDRLVVGGSALSGGIVRSHGDHRIAMACAIAGLSAAGSTEIHGWDAVETSYPGFAADMATLVAR